MKNILLLLIILSINLNAQMEIEKFDLTIETKLSDPYQKVYKQFLNNEVDKISIVELKKVYDHSQYYQFLKNKTLFQSRKKWIKYNSNPESIIYSGNKDQLTTEEAELFNNKFIRIDREFIQTEKFLDSIETNLALKEIFNGQVRDIVDMCYLPRHAVLFYNKEGRVSGIYEICFECSNVKMGIVGTKLISRKSPYIRSLFFEE